MTESGRLGTIATLARRRAVPGDVAALMLLAVLVAAALVRVGGNLLPLERGGGDGAAEAFMREIDELDDGRPALVVFDADLGTYGEIVHPTRAALRQLTAAGRPISIVSFTPEGRLLALAELDRLADGAAAGGTPRDLGYRAGAEAALARSVEELDLASFELVLLVGGSDIGPRSWVEQVQPRTGGPQAQRLIAIAPSLLLPELEPYRSTAQLAALLSNPRDGLAYAARVDADTEPSGRAPGVPPSGLAVLVGMVAALGVLALALARRVLVGVRLPRIPGGAR